MIYVLHNLLICSVQFNNILVFTGFCNHHCNLILEYKTFFGVVQNFSN